MGDIAWSLVKTITKLYDGCGGGGICCMGNSEMLAYYEEQNSASGLTFNAQRLIRSADKGQTWTEISPYLEPTAYSINSLWFPAPGRLFSVGTGKVLCASVAVNSTNTVGAVAAGYLQPSGQPGAGGAPLTSDRGVTWRNAALDLGELDMTGATLLGFTTAGYTYFSATEFWLNGFINDFNSMTIPNIGFVKTSDGGATWTLGSIIDTDIGLTGAGDFILDGTFLGSNIVLLGSSHGPGALTGNGLIAKSTDRGATWTTKNLPITGTAFVIDCHKAVLLSGTTLLACGTKHGSPNKPALWKSTDNGDTWTNIAPNLIAVAPNGQNCNDILALGGSRAVVGVKGDPSTGHKFWYLTEDAGATWTACTMNDASGEGIGANPQQFAIAEDGAILCSVRESGGVGTQPMEIWRGVISGFDVPTSPCAGAATVLLGVSHDCGHAFAPNPCPQECAAVPASRGIVGTSFSDVVTTTNTGFGTALFLLGLGNSVLTPRATVALGKLSTCGHGFMANATDQFCGVN